MVESFRLASSGVLALLTCSPSTKQAPDTRAAFCSWFGNGNVSVCWQAGCRVGSKPKRGFPDFIAAFLCLLSFPFLMFRVNLHCFTTWIILKILEVDLCLHLLDYGKIQIAQYCLKKAHRAWQRKAALFLSYTMPVFTLTFCLRPHR